MATEVAKKRQWLALNHHRNTRGLPLDFDRFPYLRAVYADNSENIVMQTGTQTGKTEWVTCDSMALISLGLSYQHVQPKDDLRGLFLRTRIAAPISKTKYYKQHVAVRGSLVEWKQRGTMRVTFSNVPNEMIAFPADAVSVDEVDFCDLNNLNLLPDRMMGSDYRFERRTSTPTTIGHNAVKNINYYYQHSDQKKWYVECSHCGEWQELNWYRQVVEEERDKGTGMLLGFRLRDDDWHERCGRDILLICPFCGGDIDRLGSGRWVAENPKVTDVSGYQISKLPSPLISVQEMYHAYNTAQGNPQAMQRFCNSYLGIPYQGVGDKITEEMIDANRQVYSMIGYNLSRLSDREASMGVDVGQQWLDVRISDHPSPGVRRLLFAGKVKWNAIAELVRVFRVRLMVIDEEPERQKVLELQDKLDIRVVAALNRQLLTGESNPSVDDVRTKNDVKKITLDRTIWMDRVQQTYVRRQNLVPSNWRSLIEGKYREEMTTPTRTVEIDNQGRERFVWTQGKDHQFLADVYDLVATQIAFPGSGGHSGIGMSDPFPFRITTEKTTLTEDWMFEMD